MSKNCHFPTRIHSFLCRLIRATQEDCVNVYAAQATLFVIISSIPFFSLLLSVIGLLLPDYPFDDLLLPNINGWQSDFLTFLWEEIQASHSISLLSVSAIVTLWSASRGITAVRDGIGLVYAAKPGKNYLTHRLISLLFTVFFAVFILCYLVLTLFGDFLLTRLSAGISIVFLKLREPFFTLVLTLLFTILYTVIAMRSDTVSHRILRHLPGGVFTALGFMIFSFCYTFYLHTMKPSSGVHGSLGAICFILLWLYFSMIILLTGAEINKLLQQKEPINSISEA